jgi:RNA polymerase sigma factor (sigma-70 family)
MLGNVHDAEDAFQATFLVLAKKAARVAGRDSVGAWLYGVARRAALEARRAATRRRAREARAASRASPAVGGEWRAVLDAELARLPAKYRAVLVACELEELTRREAAERLGCKEGTVASRLARAKAMLAGRLARRGLAPAAVAAALAEGPADGRVPERLIGATVEAAAGVAAGRAAAGLVSAPVAALTERMTRAMLMTKLRVATAALLAAGLAVGGGWAARQSAVAGCGPAPLALAYEPAATPADPEKPAEKPAKDKLDLPTGPAPVQMIAWVDEDGEVIIQQKVTTYRMVQKSQGDVQVAYYEPVGIKKLTAYEAKLVKVFDTAGKPVAATDLPRVLGKKQPVLVSADGRKVDPLHLRLIKDGTLVVVIEPSHQLPPPPVQAVPPVSEVPVPPVVPVTTYAPAPIPAEPPPLPPAQINR